MQKDQTSDTLQRLEAEPAALSRLAQAGTQEAENVNQTEAKTRIVPVWENFVRDKTEMFRAILAEKPNYASSPEVASFLKFLESKKAPTCTPISHDRSSTTPKTRQPFQRHEPSYSLKHFFLLDREYTQHNAKTAYQFIFNKLVDEYGTSFLEELEPQMRGSKNRQLSKKLSELPKMARESDINYHKLPEGWLLNCHMSNRDIRRYLQKACRVLNIPFDSRSGLMFSNDKS